MIRERKTKNTTKYYEGYPRPVLTFLDILTFACLIDVTTDISTEFPPLPDSPPVLYLLTFGAKKEILPEQWRHPLRLPESGDRIPILVVNKTLPGKREGFPQCLHCFFLLDKFKVTVEVPPRSSLAWSETAQEMLPLSGSSAAFRFFPPNNTVGDPPPNV